MKREINSWGARGVLRVGSSLEEIWTPEHLALARFPFEASFQVAKPALPADAELGIDAIFVCSRHTRQSARDVYFVCLGASFRPNRSEVLGIRTNVSRTCMTGLHEELAAYVTYGATIAADHAGVPPGELTFDLAIQIPVDMQPSRFAMAAATITSALRPALLSATDQELEAATTGWLDIEMFSGMGDLRSRFTLLPAI